MIQELQERLGKGSESKRKVSVSLQIKVNAFCLYNCKEIEKWIKIYEQGRAKREEDRKES